MITRSRAELLRGAALAATFVLLCVASVHAQVPPCEGEDPTVAARALDEGDRAADRAIAALQRHHAADAEAAWNEALTAYDRACAAGEDQALERRAIPLFRLGRVAEAASSLDTFLADHPADQLEPALARRVAANLRAIERRVATLVITPTPANATVIVDGITRGVGPVRVRVAAETNVTVVARAEGYARFRLSSTYGVGEHDVRADLLAGEDLAPETPPDEEPAIVLTPEPGSERVLAVYHAAPRDSIALLVPGVVLGALAGIATILGVLNVLESEGESVGVFNNRTDAGLVGSGLLIGAGVAAIASVTLLVLHATRPSTEPRSRVLRCAPGLASVACDLRF